MKDVQIFDNDYNDETDEFFATVSAAAEYALRELPSDDFPYMIGYPDERGIRAFVFQGQVYFPRKSQERTP